MSRPISKETDMMMKMLLKDTAKRNFKSYADSEETRLKFLEVAFEIAFPSLMEDYNGWKKKEENL